jgi:hypothetical protein
MMAPGIHPQTFRMHGLNEAIGGRNGVLLWLVLDRTFEISGRLYYWVMLLSSSELRDGRKIHRV